VVGARSEHTSPPPEGARRAAHVGMEPGHRFAQWLDQLGLSVSEPSALGSPGQRTGCFSMTAGTAGRTLGRVRRVFVETAFRAGDVLGDAAALTLGSSRLRTAHLGSRVDRKPDCRCPPAVPPVAAVQRGRPCWRAGYGSRHLRRAMPKVTTSLSAFDKAHHRKLLGTGSF
jgi:hypothetical protein